MYQTIAPYNQVYHTFKNNSGSLIQKGRLVEIDPTPSGSATTEEKQTIDPFATTRGPLEGQNDVLARLYSVQTAAVSTTAGDKCVLGVATADIQDGEWGQVCVWGPALLSVDDTTDEAHLKAYGTSNANAGQAEVVTPTAIETAAAPFVVAFQIGASGTTTAGDLRDVFMVTGFHGGFMDTQCAFGTLT